MRAVVQRVKQAGVSVGERKFPVSKRTSGFTGSWQGDTREDLEYLAEKLSIFVFLKMPRGK